MQVKTLQDDQDHRQKGIGSSSGKIIKGILNQAPVKLNISSIPTKFQNVIYRKTSKPAFGDSTSKFFKLNANDTSISTPGPGAYNPTTKIQNVQSKKGSGFFASQSRLHRLDRVRSHIPGPGAYKQMNFKSNQSRNKRHSHRSNNSKLNSSASTANLSSTIQYRDLFKNEVSDSKSKPGVGAYELNPEKLTKSSSAYSTFRSKVDRFVRVSAFDIPPVGTYELKESVRRMNLKTKMYKNEQSLNKSNTEQQLKQVVSKLQQKETKQKVGPGAYEMNSTLSTKFFRIKQAIHDRFGELKPIYKTANTIVTESVPEIDNKQPFTRWHASNSYNSAFKSATQRHDFRLNNLMDPGKYNVTKTPGRKSHLINFMQKWV